MRNRHALRHENEMKIQNTVNFLKTTTATHAGCARAFNGGKRTDIPNGTRALQEVYAFNKKFRTKAGSSERSRGVYASGAIAVPGINEYVKQVFID